MVMVWEQKWVPRSTQNAFDFVVHPVFLKGGERTFKGPLLVAQCDRSSKNVPSLG